MSNNISRTPLLITASSIATAAMTALTKTQDRVKHTEIAISHWLNIDPMLSIVVCDGSGYDLGNALSSKFDGTTIEWLHFQNDQEGVRLKGKGYGEGEIVKYALEHSRILNDCDAFIKCTAKLWANNHSKIMNAWNGKFICDCEFRHLLNPRKFDVDYLDTRYYVTNKQFYIEHLSDAHTKANDARGRFLEHCFKEATIDKGITGFVPRFDPEIHGTSGSKGSEYQHTIKSKIRDRIKRAMMSLLTDLQIKN